MSPKHKEYASQRIKEGICPLCSKTLTKFEVMQNFPSWVCHLEQNNARIHYLIDVDREYYQLGDIYQEQNFTWVLVDLEKCETKITMPDQGKTIAYYQEIFLAEERNKLQSFLNFL